MENSPCIPRCSSNTIPRNCGAWTIISAATTRHHRRNRRVRNRGHHCPPREPSKTSILSQMGRISRLGESVDAYKRADSKCDRHPQPIQRKQQPLKTYKDAHLRSSHPHLAQLPIPHNHLDSPPNCTSTTRIYSPHHNIHITTRHRQSLRRTPHPPQRPTVHPQSQLLSKPHNTRLGQRRNWLGNLGQQRT